MKTAFLFPGQGAQKTGMGKSFYEADKDARNVFENASKLIGTDMAALCFEPDERLNQTEYTQAAMVTAGIAMLKAVEKRGITADICAGLSLGEYEALYLASVMDEDTAIRAVRQRGIFMQEEAAGTEGAMAAVLMLDMETVEKVIADIDSVWIANYNCPGQIVISGKKTSVEEAAPKLKEAGAKRVLPLNVSGAFHSPLLKGAGDRLYEYLRTAELSEPAIPYTANVNAGIISGGEDIRELLRQQVYSPVKFEQSIRAMLENGVGRFIEIGPGKTLSGFVKKIDDSAEIYSVENIDELDRLAETVSN